MNRVRTGVAVVLLASGCAKAPPDANPEFSDATVYLFRAFDEPEVDVAFALRALEGVVLSDMDVDSDDVRDRALTPSYLTPADVAGLETPTGADVSNALPVAVGGASAFDVDQQTAIQLLVDHTVVEPYSPDYYERTFLEDTETCWADRGCDRLLTWNDLVKKNFLMEVPYDFNKDFRWVDMNLPDPEDVPAGEEPTNDGEPRWAYVARSWMTESAEGEGGNTEIIQSYTIETWIPRDGGGTLRFLTLWSETDLGIAVSEDTVAGTTRAGIDENYQAQEAWLEEHAAP